jgi:hypothetical protein
LSDIPWREGVKNPVVMRHGVSFVLVSKRIKLCISLTVFSIAHGTVKSLNELEIDSYEFLKLFDRGYLLMLSYGQRCKWDDRGGGSGIF